MNAYKWQSETSDDENYDVPVKSRRKVNRDTSIFLRGMIVGFGLAAVASTMFNIFSEQRAIRRSRIGDDVDNISGKEGVMGDITYVIDESTSAFQDAVRTLDKTFESGVKAIESVQEVIDKIRDV